MWQNWSPRDKQKLLKRLKDEIKKWRGAYDYLRFQGDPVGYAETVLGLSPWPGRNAKGQRELFEDIGESVRRQLAGDKSAPKIFRVEAGHGVGKTFGAAMLVNWFFDCFPPTSIPGSVTLTTAPTKAQVEELLWKDVKSMRPSTLPGRVFAGTPADGERRGTGGRKAARPVTTAGRAARAFRASTTSSSLSSWMKPKAFLTLCSTRRVA